MAKRGIIMIDFFCVCPDGRQYMLKNFYVASSLRTRCTNQERLSSESLAVFCDSASFFCGIVMNFLFQTPVKCFQKLVQRQKTSREQTSFKCKMCLFGVNLKAVILLMLRNCRAALTDTRPLFLFALLSSAVNTTVLVEI